MINWIYINISFVISKSVIASAYKTEQLLEVLGRIPVIYLRLKNIVGFYAQDVSFTSVENNGSLLHYGLLTVDRKKFSAWKYVGTSFPIFSRKIENFLAIRQSRAKWFANRPSLMKTLENKYLPILKCWKLFYDH